MLTFYRESKRSSEREDWIEKKNIHKSRETETEGKRESDQQQGDAIQNTKESKVEKKTHPNEMNGALQFAFDLKLSQKPAFCSVNIYIKRSSFVNFIYGSERHARPWHTIFSLFSSLLIFPFCSSNVFACVHLFLASFTEQILLDLIKSFNLNSAPISANTHSYTAKASIQR